MRRIEVDDNLKVINMSLQLLISTMNQEDYELLEKINICADAVVINQCDRVSETRINKDGNNVLWINTTERGLSKSRNLALSKATADICLLVDDDEELNPEGIAQIEDEFKKYKDASIIRFQVRGIEKPFKKYSEKRKKLGYLSAMKISSVEVAIRRKNIIENNIRFDELVGAGTEFPCGEENVFVNQCLLKGLKVYYVPVCIANLHIGNSSWFFGHDEKYFLGQGGSFTAMNPKYGRLLILQFAIRHKNLYDMISFRRALAIMFEGRKKYLLKKRQNDF